MPRKTILVFSPVIAQRELRDLEAGLSVYYASECPVVSHPNHTHFLATEILILHEDASALGTYMYSPPAACYPERGESPNLGDVSHC